MIRKILSLLKKELKHIFYSPMAYIVSGIFLIITGWFFTNALFLGKEAELKGMIDIIPMLLMFFMPAIGMKSIAEEKKVGTIQILLTMPVKEWEVIISKYLSCIVLYIVILSFTKIYVLILYLLGKPDIGEIVTSYIAMFLLGATYISISLFASVITSSQVIAFIVGFSIIFTFFILSKLEMVLPLTLQNIIEKFSIMSHFENMLRGVIDLSDIVYFLFLNLFFLMLSTYLLIRRRE